MKKILSLVFTFVFVFEFSSASEALDLSESFEVNLLGSPYAAPRFLAIENVSMTFFITNTGRASIVYSVSSSPNSGTVIIKTYIEKRTAGIFWRRLNISKTNNEWTERTTKSYYTGSHYVDVSDDGTYRATVKVTASNGDTATKTAIFDHYKSILLGDVNFDGKVTASDARLVLRYSAKLISFSSAQKSRSDLNFDNRITSSDARMVLRVSAGLI